MLLTNVHRFLFDVLFLAFKRTFFPFRQVKVEKKNPGRLTFSFSFSFSFCFLYQHDENKIKEEYFSASFFPDFGTKKKTNDFFSTY